MTMQRNAGSNLFLSIGLGLCSAALMHAAKANPPLSVPSHYIFQFWDADHKDSITSGDICQFQGHKFIRTEAELLNDQEPGSIPIKLFSNDNLSDHALVATAQGEEELRMAGYRFVRIEGYAYPQAGYQTLPLMLYWNPMHTDYLATTDTKEAAKAKEAGYDFIRIEAYVLPPPPEQIAPRTICDR